MTNDRGSFSVELAILAPVIILLFAIVYTMGQLVSAQNRVQNAAQDSARAATASGNEADFAGVASKAAGNALQGWDCTPTTNVPAAPPAGTLDNRLITVDVSCQVHTMIGVTHTITAHAASPVDPYRSALGG